MRSSTTTRAATGYECWDERTYNEYVSMFGPITKREALGMFRREYSIQREHAAMAAW